MPRPAASRTLQKILDIRVVQRQAAEALTAKSAKEVSALQQLQDENRARRTAAEAQWRGVMSGSSMALHMMNSLAADVLTEEAGIRRTEGDIAEAEDRKAEAGARLRSALANEDAAGSLTRAARRAETRRREDAVLSEASDRLQHRGAVA